MSSSEESRVDPSGGKSGASPSGPGVAPKDVSRGTNLDPKQSGGGKGEKVSPGETEPVRNTPPPDLPFGGD